MELTNYFRMNCVHTIELLVHNTGYTLNKEKTFCQFHRVFISLCWMLFSFQLRLLFYNTNRSHVYYRY